MTLKNTISRTFQAHGLFLLFLILGLILRLVFSQVQGLSHDELSAWNRIGAYSFNQVLNEGVRPDMHPAFMQVLLQYWTLLFGDSEFALRLPSVIFSFFGILLVYHIGLKFFNRNAAILACVLLLFPVFPIIHTTLARPYAPGFFFLVLFLYGIFKLEDSRTTKEFIYSGSLLTIAATGAIYTHYYAGLLVALIGLSSLLYVKIVRWHALFLSGLLTVLLFLLHWNITKEHLSRDGLGWLGEPEWHWLWDYFKLYFGDNYWFAGAFVILIPLGLIYAKFKSDRKARFLLLTFVFVYVSSHLISIFYTPILREPGVFMLIPLLLLGLGSFFKSLKDKIFNWSISVLVVFILVNTLFTSKLFESVHFEPFREMTELVKKYDDQLGREKIMKLCNVTNINYLNYYARRNGANLDFEMTLIEEIDQIHELARRIENNNKEYVMLARTNRAQNVIQLEIVQNRYPKTVAARVFFNANFNVWTKGDFGDRVFMDRISSDNKPELFKDWFTDTTKNEFVGDLRIPVAALRKDDSYLLFRTEGWISDEVEGLNFVVVAERAGQLLQEDETPVLYQAWDQLALDSSQGQRTFFTAVEIPEKLTDSDVLHVYFWNRNFALLKIEKPIIYVVPKY